MVTVVVGAGELPPLPPLSAAEQALTSSAHAPNRDTTSTAGRTRADFSTRSRYAMKTDLPNSPESFHIVTTPAGRSASTSNQAHENR